MNDYIKLLIELIDEEINRQAKMRVQRGTPLRDINKLERIRDILLEWKS